jgi:nicotinamide phosphoribosyltransferase
MNPIEDNIILLTDGYKPTHFKQYPPDTQTVYSYMESRGGEFDEIVPFGFQYIIEKYLTGPVVTMDKLFEAEAVFGDYFGRSGLFDRDMWLHIIRNHGGRLPLKIRAIEEGTPVAPHVAIMTIENTDRTERCFALTNYVETLLMQSWYPTTVASYSRAVKQDILGYLERTGTPAEIDYKMHDFGFRGSTCVEQAAIGGAAHLINFKGSDTLPPIRFVRNAYGFNGMPSNSIPASEHSTMCSWGRDGELDAYRNMLEQYPEGIVACVSDQYNIINAAENLWGGDELRGKIMKRNGTLVIRPDSGDPVTVIAKLLYTLESRFGTSVNAKGYRTLPAQLRVIQGDGVNRKSINEILAMMERSGWSADNIAFGSGGALLQAHTRDSAKFAIKCSAVERGYVWHDVYKDPVTDSGKRSKRGRLATVETGHGYETMAEIDQQMLGRKNALHVVFENGELVKRTTFEAVRERAAIGVPVAA